MPACVNHPEKQVKRRCYACHAHICPACTLHVDRHYFCSSTCHLAWKIEEPLPSRRRRKGKKARKQAKRQAVAERTGNSKKAEAARTEAFPGPVVQFPEGPPSPPAFELRDTAQAPGEDGRLLLLPEGPPSRPAEVFVQEDQGAHALSPEGPPSPPAPAPEETLPAVSLDGLLPEGPPSPSKESVEEAYHDDGMVTPIALVPEGPPTPPLGVPYVDSGAETARLPEGPPTPPLTGPRTDNERAEAPEAGAAAATRQGSLPPADLPTQTVTAPRTMVVRQIEVRRVGRKRMLGMGAVNVALLLLLLMLVFSGSESERLTAASLRPTPVPPTADELVPPAISALPVETTASSIVLEGSALPGDRVRILVNGEVVQTLPEADGLFETAPLALRVGLNVIQVMLEGPSGVRYSAARMVERVSGEQAPSAPGLISLDRGSPQRNAVAFTFDGGASDNAAREILATLRERDLRTTLFLTGEFIESFPDIVREAVADGHEIGNHTWDHPHLTTFEQNRRHDTAPSMTEFEFKSQLARTEAAFVKVTGQRLAPWWRAPFGEVNAQLRTWAHDLGYRHVGWTRNIGGLRTLDSLDWVDQRDSTLYLTAGEFYDRFSGLARRKQGAANGAIFLMHLGTRRTSDQLHRELGRLLDAYLQNGYEILPVSDLVAKNDAPL